MLSFRWAKRLIKTFSIRNYGLCYYYIHTFFLWAITIYLQPFLWIRNTTVSYIGTEIEISSRSQSFQNCLVLTQWGQKLFQLCDFMRHFYTLCQIDVLKTHRISCETVLLCMFCEYAIVSSSIFWSHCVLAYYTYKYANFED